MEQKITTTKIALKWGIIAGLATIIISTIINMTGLWRSAGVSMLTFVFLAAFLYLAMKEYRTENESYMTYGQGLGIGTLVGAVAGILGSLYGKLYTSFIDPTFVQQNLDYQYEKMEEQGLSDAQIEQAMGITEKFTSGGISIIIGLVFMVFISFLLSLIIAAILKKNKPTFE